jgi:hypothetical protein
MATETETFTASNGTDITSVGSSIWAYGAGTSGDIFVTANEFRPRLSMDLARFARRAGTFTDDQYAQVKLTALVSQSRVGVGVRANNAGSGYLLYVASGDYYLVKLVSGAFTILRYGANSFSVNDIIRLEVSGTGLTCKQNGTSFWTETDSALTSGNPGICGWGPSATVFSAADDWEGGDLAAAALQNFQYDWPHQLHARR